MTTASAGVGTLPLEGLRVVEVGAWVAGPSTAGILCDWGAEVIKVEPPLGDPFRALFGVLGFNPAVPNAPFALDNRGKKSVVLDLHLAAAQEVMADLVDSADIFVSNLRPDALERFGLEPSRVLAAHPRLVYALITGYGTTGPDRDRPGYDVGAFWARSGIARSLVPEDEAPPNIRGGMGDHATALGTAAGILAALYQRERTGQGQLVESSLLRTGAFLLGWDLGIQLVVGRSAPTMAREKSATPLLNVYRSKDGRWFFLMGLEGDRHFPGLLRALERPDLRDDPRFASARLRRENAPALIAELDAIFASQTLAHWSARFDAHDVWWAAAPTPDEVVVDPQLLATGGLVDVGDEEPFRAVGTPINFGGAPIEHVGAVPTVGQHTDEVLGALGLAPARLAELREKGAIGAGP